MNKLCPLGPAGVGRIVNLFFGPAWVPSCNYTKGALIYHMNVVCAVLQRCWIIAFMIQSETVMCIFQVIIQMVIIISLYHLIGHWGCMAILGEKKSL